MFGQLFWKECVQTAKSLIYWLIVIILILDFSTQLGNTNIKKMPERGQESYGTRVSNDRAFIMKRTLENLILEYERGSYTTYPIGFYKSVTLNEKEEARIGEILKEAAGVSEKELKEQKSMSDADIDIGPAADLTYEKFEELMDEADDILGGGSSYAADYRLANAQEEMTYEEAVEEYQFLVEKDRLSGGYARLFSDYMVIALGFIPVFLAVTRCMRDRRAKMQELIYCRRAPAWMIIVSRYLSILIMLIIPVFLLSMPLLIECVQFAKGIDITVDILAFVKYILGWLLPTIMVSSAVGMLLTELTDTALAVLIQGIWWFVSIFSAGIMRIQGGLYGWNLMPRHNTEFNYTGFQDGFSQLASNRIFYASLAVLILALTVFVYGQKRKGRFQIRGKIMADRKDKSKA